MDKTDKKIVVMWILVALMWVNLILSIVTRLVLFNIIWLVLAICIIILQIIIFKELSK